MKPSEVYCNFFHYAGGSGLILEGFTLSPNPGWIYCICGLPNYTRPHTQQVLFPFSSNQKRKTGLVHRVQVALGSFHRLLEASLPRLLHPDLTIITHSHLQEEVTLVGNCNPAWKSLRGQAPNYSLSHVLFSSDVNIILWSQNTSMLCWDHQIDSLWSQKEKRKNRVRLSYSWPAYLWVSVALWSEV